MQYTTTLTDLPFTDVQRGVLQLLAEAGSGLRAQSTLGSSIAALVSPPLAMAATAAVSGIQCPYGQPPEAIVGDFDANRNMYLHCLHGTKHCWTMTGQSITCP
jgi:hypothetical protein